MAKFKSYSQTYIKNVERFHKQAHRMSRLSLIYDTYNRTYYARGKRRNLLVNQFNIYKNINPLELSNSELSKVLTANAKAIRSLGFNSSMKGDLAEAAVLTELNNEAYRVVDFAESESEEYDAEYLSNEQDRVFGDMLYNNLKELRLTKYQLDQALKRSILPEETIKEVRAKVIKYWEKLRK